MRVRRLHRVAACFAAAAVLGLATAPTAGAASTGATVRIGLEAPLSGDQKSTGEGMLRGAQLAAKELNAKGGIGGKQVEIVPIDDAADPATGVTAAKAAIASGLDGVVGPYNSGVGAQTLPLYIAAGLVPIRLTSADSTNGLGLTLQPMTYQIAPAASDALTQWLKAKSVAIVYDDSTLYTTTVSSALKSELQAAGVTISAFEPIQPGAKTYASTISKVEATNPDVIYLATYYPEGGLMAKEIYAAKGKAKCLADYGAYDNGFIEAAGKKAAQGCPVVGVPAPPEFSGAKKYVAAYRKAYKAEPGVWSPYTYDSLNFLAQGVAQAGGFDAAKLTAALDKVSGFSGWTGSVTIDPTTGNRDPATVVVLSTDKGGSFHLDEVWAKAVGAQV
ncbi:MAG: branched-chain amino acid ABC transporter substrate-binding protein [Acidimicrobiia bacterium]|jgi:branched-chain amino acid transport system substrate-binding protein